MNIYGSKYVTKNDDFSKMMLKPEFSKTLFIFNDNETEHDSAKRGAGNAIMRKYNIYGVKDNEAPRSHGIPTGVHRKGYTQLDDRTKFVIDSAFEEIRCLLESFEYDSIAYSIEDNDNIILGTNIFKVDREVIIYITREILKLGTKFFFIQDGNIDNSGYLEIDEELLNMIE